MNSNPGMLAWLGGYCGALLGDVESAERLIIPGLSRADRGWTAASEPSLDHRLDRLFAPRRLVRFEADRIVAPLRQAVSPATAARQVAVAGGQAGKMRAALPEGERAFAIRP